ncbi:MAG TPA: WbqC family protein [Xanthobacteraceae bacterium]|nr:WbqC family protein [Xanthobacteraceae bacterium]
MTQTSPAAPAGPSTAPFTIAVMQPYFIPYAGYFRLFAASDLFVIYDCVQFARRGWVHRNRLVDRAGAERWLTLPLQKAARDVLIRDLRFAPDAAALFARRLRPFRLPEAADAARIVAALNDVGGTPVDYIVRLLEEIVAYLGLPWRAMRSSALDLPPALRGQGRILEIARRLGARRYLNAPGGRSLYDAAAFEQAGVELRFLPDYAGPTASILTRLVDEDRDALARDIRG